MNSNGEVSKWNACLFILRVRIQSGQASVRINPRFIYFWSTSQSTAADGGRERGLIYYIFLWVARAPLRLFSRLARRIRPPMCVNNFSIFKLKEVTRYEMDFLIWSKRKVPF